MNKLKGLIILCSATVGLVVIENGMNKDSGSGDSTKESAIEYTYTPYSDYDNLIDNLKTVEDSNGMESIGLDKQDNYKYVGKVSSVNDDNKYYAVDDLLNNRVIIVQFNKAKGYKKDKKDNFKVDDLIELSVDRNGVAYDMVISDKLEEPERLSVAIDE